MATAPAPAPASPVEQLRNLVAWLYVSAPGSTLDQVNAKFKSADALIAAAKEQPQLNQIELAAIQAAIASAIQVHVYRISRDPALAAMVMRELGK